MIRLVQSAVTLGLVVMSATTPARSAASVAPIPQPSFQYVASAGCADVFLYTWNAPRSEVLTAYIDIKKLGLGPGTHVIDIATAGDAVRVGIDVYDSPVAPGGGVDVHGNLEPKLPYCDDMGPFAKAAETWRAVAGKLTLTVGEPGGVPGRPAYIYKATLRVDSLKIVGPDGRKLGAPAPVVLTGTVGWVGG